MRFPILRQSDEYVGSPPQCSAPLVFCTARASEFIFSAVDMDPLRGATRGFLADNGLISATHALNWARHQAIVNACFYHSMRF